MQKSLTSCFDFFLCLCFDFFFDFCKVRRRNMSEM